MIKCKVALCSESVVVDSKSNNASIFNIIEQISSQTFPRPLKELAFFFLLVKDEDDADVFEGTLVLKLADKELQRFPMRADFQGKLRTRLIANLGGLVLTEPGILRISLISERRNLGAWDIQVSKVGKPHITTSQG